MKKTKLMTFILLSMTIILMGAIFYIASALISGSSESRPIGLVKTKAQSRTYSRTIALNVASPTPSPTFTPFPTPTEEITLTKKITPTPTEIILAYNNPSPTNVGTVSATISISPLSSPTSTQTTSLPAAGYITNALAIFAAATLLIFFAFIF